MEKIVITNIKINNINTGTYSKPIFIQDVIVVNYFLEANPEIKGVLTMKYTNDIGQIYTSCMVDLEKQKTMKDHLDQFRLILEIIAKAKIIGEIMKGAKYSEEEILDYYKNSSETRRIIDEFISKLK